MDDLKRIRLKRLSYLAIAVVLAGLTLFVLRGPHISNVLKKLILPELETAMGRKVIAQKIHINLLPLFIEAKGMKVFDDFGERIFFIQRVKAYINLSGLFSRRIVIRRLVLKEPEVRTDRKQAEEIINNVRRYLDKTRDTALKVKVSAVAVQKGNAGFNDMENKTISDIKDIAGEIILGDVQKIKGSAQRVVIRREGWPEIAGDADIYLLLKEGVIQIKRLGVGISGSKMSGTGEYHDNKGGLKLDMALLVMTVKEIFKLNGSGEGSLNVRGDITYKNISTADSTPPGALQTGIPHNSGWKDPGGVFIDLKLDGKFYIQTLMELLKVKERVEGFIDAEGEIKGRLNDIKGAGTAVLRKGNLFNVDVDSLKCGVTYSGGTMKFTDGEGRLYNGKARVSASINLPVVNFFTLDIDFSNVDSVPVFRLIGWDPGVGPGKVNGNLKSRGAIFNPEGSFEYKTADKGRDVLGRVSDITGRYGLQGSLLSLTGLRLDTVSSSLTVNGIADLHKRILDLDSVLSSKDIADISSPYYNRLKGSGDFTGKITGHFDDPLVKGRIRVYKPAFKDFTAEQLDADIVYSKKVMDIKEMSFGDKGESYNLSGSIYFNNAQRLFDLSEPEYKLKASVRNARLEKFVKIFHPDFTGRGRLHAGMRILGKPDKAEIRGNGVIDNASVYDIPFDSASFEWDFIDGKLNLSKAKVAKGRSVLHADAEIDAEGNFSYKASSDKILLSDLVQRDIRGDAIFDLKTEGHGTFDNPSIYLNARMLEGTLKGRPVGSGVISAVIKEKDISLKAGMLNEKINITARGRFEKDVPWDAKIEIRTGRYDFLVGSFLKDTPEDLILSLNGAVFLHGDKRHIFAKTAIKQMTLSMYGYSFTNEKEIKMELSDRELTLDNISMRSGSASLRIDGSLVIGRQYNLTMEGSSSLSPFKGLSGKIGILKGEADFILSVTGDWETPLINGGVNLVNGSFGLKEYSYRLSSVNGYLYMDNDRIVLQRLSGKLSGGDVEISGIVYLKKFSVKRFYVEAGMNNITTSVSGDFNVNFGGNILYKGTPSSQIISGDIKVNRARYRERVEWKSWLLKTKKVDKFKAEISDLEKAELNVKITGKDNIYIDNNVARAAVNVDMILRGTIYRPILLGRLESKEGTVYFRNNEFRILHASADFSDPNRINPMIEIASETIVKGYKIKMNMEGQMDHFNMSLSSDPVLKEMDILALLTVGQKGGELKGLEGSIGAGEATSFVTGKFQDVIEERLRTITGLDRFQVDPYVSKTTGTIEPRVTVSKRLLGEKMFVTYTSSVGSSEEQIIKIEYFLGKNVSVVGVRDERGILGGDIRFRFEFK